MGRGACKIVPRCSAPAGPVYCLLCLGNRDGMSLEHSLTLTVLGLMSCYVLLLNASGGPALQDHDSQPAIPPSPVPVLGLADPHSPFASQGCPRPSSSPYRMPAIPFMAGGTEGVASETYSRRWLAHDSMPRLAHVNWHRRAFSNEGLTPLGRGQRLSSSPSSVFRPLSISSPRWRRRRPNPSDTRDSAIQYGGDRRGRGGGRLACPCCPGLPCRAALRACRSPARRDPRTTMRREAKLGWEARKGGCIIHSRRTTPPSAPYNKHTQGHTHACPRVRVLRGARAGGQAGDGMPVETRH